MPTPNELVGKYLSLPERPENKELGIQGRVAHVVEVVNGKLKITVGAGPNEKTHIVDAASVTDEPITASPEAGSQ